MSHFSKFLIFATLVAISVADLITVTDVRISQGERDEADETYGVVYGAKSCGGPGQFVHLHFEGCTTTDSICQVVANNQTRRGFLEFIPSTNIEQLGLRMLLSVDGGEYKEIVNKKISTTAVVAGVEARISGASRTSEKLKEKLVGIQHQLYNVENGVDELCVESQYQIV